MPCSCQVMDEEAHVISGKMTNKKRIAKLKTNVSRSVAVFSFSFSGSLNCYVTEAKGLLENHR